MESADAINRAATSNVTVIFAFCFILPSNSFGSCRIIRSNVCRFPCLKLDLTCLFSKAIFKPIQ
jgi:hypothetical protein